MEHPQSSGRPPDPSADTSRARAPAGVRRPDSLFATLAFFILGGVVGAGVMHFGLERPALDAAQARAQTYEQDLAALRGRLEIANNAAAALEGRLQVEESTRRGLETGLQAMQTELGQARDSLAFYEQLMPPGPQGAISVRALDIERVGPHLKYRLLLMRSGSNGKSFLGSLQFLAKGRLGEQETTVTLLPSLLSAAPESEAPAALSDPGASTSVEADTGAELMAVEFTDFQRGSGILSLPPGFEPESVTVNVLEGRAIRTSRTVELPPVSSIP